MTHELYAGPSHARSILGDGRNSRCLWGIGGCGPREFEGVPFNPGLQIAVLAVPEFPSLTAQARADEHTEVQAHRPGRMLDLPDLTFDNFFVGDANRQAYEASVYAATHIGYVFSPRM